MLLTIPNNIYRDWWARTWIAAGNLLLPLGGRVRGVGRMRNVLQVYIGQPGRLVNHWQGNEDFDFPGTSKLLDLPPERPDIVHCHNLHGGWPESVYFDLRISCLAKPAGAGSAHASRYLAVERSLRLIHSGAIVGRQVVGTVRT